MSSRTAIDIGLASWLAGRGRCLIADMHRGLKKAIHTGAFVGRARRGLLRNALQDLLAAQPDARRFPRVILPCSLQKYRP